MPTAITGLFKAKASPFTAAEPILKPVYDPGPALSEKASKSVISILASSNIFSIKTWSCSP